MPAANAASTAPTSRRALLLACLAAPFVAPACSPLATFNAVAGSDAGAEAAAADIPFGPHPRQRLDVYRPTGAQGLRPVAFFIYGGSWNSGRRQDYAFAGQALASRGYVTVIADYRLVPEVAFPAFLDDNALALRWARDNAASYGGDASRIALIGHSAGAYNAAMLALDLRHLRKAGVEPSRIKAFIGLAGPYDFLPFTSTEAAAAFGAWPEPREAQPVSFARAGAPPALLLTGADDGTVNPRNTAALAAALRARGSSVEQHVYPGVDHVSILLALSRLLRGRAPVLRDVETFLARHLPQDSAAARQ